MEKPSTKKPMNVLKTMVFLENFMIKDKKCPDKTHRCEDCIWWLICNPEQAPDKEYSQPYTAYDDQP